MNLSQTFYLKNKVHNLFANEEFINNHGILLVVILSGVFGFILGLAYPTWQIMVECSQVVAGIVKYDRGNPLYMLHVKIWTILNQIGAIALLLGVSDKMLSQMISGCIGMVYFQGLSLFVFVLGRNLLVSIAVPFFMQFVHIAEFGINYSTKLIGTMHTYGAIGQGLVFLIIALFCAKRYRVGGVLLGLAPAVHPALGLLLCVSLLVVFLWDFNKLRQSFILSLKYFLVGCLISVISLATHYQFTYDVPKVSVDAMSRYVDVVVQYWDYHRKPVNFKTIDFYLGFLSLATSIALLRLSKRGLPEDFIFPLRVLVVIGVLSILACVFTHVPPEFLNRRIIGAMPARFLNINILGLIPLLAGVITYYRNDFYIQLIFLVLTVSLTLFLSLLPYLLGVIAMAIVVTLCVIDLVLKIYKREHSSADQFKAERTLVITMVLFVLIIEGVCIEANASWKANINYYQNWENNELYARIHEGKGTLLVGPQNDRTAFYAIQLYTRRPVLLGPIIAIPVIPESGPAIDGILRNVYGVDLFNPTYEAKRVRDIPLNEVQALWESRTLNQWEEIKSKFLVTDVFTYAYWRLQLPIVYSTAEPILLPGDGKVKHDFKLYHIP